MTYPYPESRREEVRETLHGVAIVDPYRWLEDQESPETRDWIDRQNAFTRSLLEPLRDREALTQRLEQLIKVEAVSIPTVRGGRVFFMRRRADQELYVILMRDGAGGEERVLVDPHPWSEDHTTSASLRAVSDDGAWIVYAVREGGEDQVTIRFQDVSTGKDLPDRLERGRYWSIELTPDRTACYYSRHDAAGPRVYYHEMGTPQSEDRVLFGEGYGPEKIIGSSLSEDGETLLYTVFHGSAGRTEVYYQDLRTRGPILPVVTDLEARTYAAAIGENLYLHTDWGASRGRIFQLSRADLQAAPGSRDRWREILPESEEVIEGLSPVGGRLFVSSLKDVTSRIKVYTPDGALEREITLPALGSAGGVSGRWNDSEVFFGFSSFHIPYTIFRYDVATDTRQEWARVRAPFESEDFEVRQVWYPSRDGTRVPLFLLYRKDLVRDVRRPTLLQGYGGFNVSLTPGFSARAAAWAERGGVVAVANLRGGGEFGEEWHRAGMLENKQNVFDDFHAAAEWLIANGYTSPEKLAISGGSNGGLLVTAALTQRPDLYRAVVCSYPLIDMLRYHQFLVGSFWVPEYGSADDPDQFRILHAYSPYHQVKSGTAYPAVLFITGDADTRVAPLHARKMTALLQAATGSDRPILLHYDTRAGHVGGLPVSKQIEDLTDELSFLFWQVG